MLINAFASFARHFASISGGAVDVIQAVHASIGSCDAPKVVVNVVLRVLPGLKADSVADDMA